VRNLFLIITFVHMYVCAYNFFDVSSASILNGITSHRAMLSPLFIREKLLPKITGARPVMSR